MKSLDVLTHTFLIFAFSILSIGCKGLSEDEQLDAIFSSQNFEQPSAIGSRTFIFFVNGDADHFVPDTASGTNSNLRRADAAEVLRIQNAASHCLDCNVALLHIQRGGEKWYTSSSPWATYLYLYSKGQKVLERKVPQLNAANPNVLARLLTFSQFAFNGSELNLLYRGHSFIPTYNPSTATEAGISPFAFSFPQSSYGPDEFVTSLKTAHLNQKLESITLASCSMANLEFSAELSKYSNFLIASQVDVLETIEVSFDFEFLKNSFNDSELTAKIISQSLMKRYDATSILSEAMMEYPISLINLKKMDGFHQQIMDLFDQVEHYDSQFFNKNQDLFFKAAHINKIPSNRYMSYLKTKQKTEEQLKSFLKNVRIASFDKTAFDLGQVLKLISDDVSLTENIREQSIYFEDELVKMVKVINNSYYEPKSGLSIQL